MHSDITQRPLRLDNLVGPPGSGKSYTNREEAVKAPGLYVFAYPQIDLLEEQASEFEKLGLWVAKVHSKAAAGAVQGQIDRKLVEFRKQGVPHGVFLMTHKAVLECDLSGFERAHWRIDEAIEVYQAGKLQVTDSDLDFWTTRFTLENPSKGWSRVLSNVAPSNFRDRSQGVMGKYSAFEAAVQQGIAFLQAEAWRAGNLNWFALWSPFRLPNPASIQISGANFGRSVSAHLLEALYPDEIEIVETHLPSRRTHQPSVRVRYFADWEATSQHWATRAGRGDLKAIAGHIRAASPNLGYWSGNDAAIVCLDHHISDREPVPAKLAGLNRLEKAQSCAFVYSAKATSEDDVLTSVMGMTTGQIRAAREDEDIFQFAFRGSIRLPGYAGDYDIYVFSRAQAELLAASLLASGLTSVAVLQEEVQGWMFAQPTAPKKGRKSKRPTETAQEKLARKATEKRERAKRSKQAHPHSSEDRPAISAKGAKCAA
ncbi:MAG: hypothetical protein KF777_24495 [Planctomycetaceae bacterium]|nr:hypothetical protein [Planctomycetaceae bacterium]